MLSAWVSTSRRVAPALLLGVSLWAAFGQARAGDPLVEARNARYWLARIHDATAHRNFQGTFVVTTGGSVVSARIAHFCEGRNQFERIESLDGERRQVYRHNDVVQSMWPHERLAVIETRQSLSQFPALLSAGAERIVAFYDIQSLGEGRVAGHEAHVLLLRPKDGFRFGYRLWAEKSSGLLLRAEVFDERDVVLEASAFSDLMIGVKSRPDLVVQAMKQLEGYRVQRPSLQDADLEREGWTLPKLPPGFRHVSSVKRLMAGAEADALRQPAVLREDAVQGAPPPVLQSIYSDGLTHVSVFIEPYNPAVHRREMLMALGATQTLARRQGDWWITVIGDVPVVTLRAFAAGLELRR